MLESPETRHGHTPLPMAELHVHLDGSVRPETLLSLASAAEIAMPAATSGALAEYMRVEEGSSLVEYLQRFEITLSVMQTARSLERIAFELVEDLALEGAVYAEVRYCPLLSTREGLDLREAVEAPLRGLRRARERYGIPSALIICALRNQPLKESIELAELASEFAGMGVVGFDLAGPEAGYPARDHAEAFAIARRSGLGITVHAGEAAGPESIEQAIDDCHAVRIGHGTRLAEDPSLLKRVRDRGIAIECCLTSNVQTGATSRYDAHPLRIYFDAGIPVSINTDNRLMSGTSLSREYELARHHLGLMPEDLLEVTRMAIASGFMSEEDRRIASESVVR